MSDEPTTTAAPVAFTDVVEGCTCDECMEGEPVTDSTPATAATSDNKRPRCYRLGALRDSLWAAFIANLLMLAVMYGLATWLL